MLKVIGELITGGDFYDEPQLIDDDEYDSSEIGAIKAFSWPLLLQASGLVDLSGKKLKLSASGLKALNSQPAATIRTIWKKWVKSTL
jgi:hypothetical protein